MIVRLVAHSDLLFLYSPPEFAVHKIDPRKNREWLFLKNPAHMVQEPDSDGRRGRPLKVIQVGEKILRIFMALLCRQREPMEGGFLVLRDLFPQKVQFSEGVLSELVSLFRGGGKPVEGVRHIFWDATAGEQELSQLILRQ